MLIGGAAPEALSVLLAEAAGDDCSAEAGVRLVRGDVVDAGVVMLVVIPYEYGIGTPENYALAAKVYWQAYVRNIPAALEKVRRLVPHVKI